MPTAGDKALAHEEPAPPSSKHERLQAALDRLVGSEAIVGATLVSRDGIRVMDRWKREMWNRETFSAMSATLMGAAEIALSESGGARTRRVLAETAKHRMAVVGAGEELVLVALAEVSLGLEGFLTLVEDAAEDVAGIVLGG